jgi:hypothetical protein
MSALAGIDRDLKALAEVAPNLAASGLAESARVLAGELDKPKNSATSKANCARALLDTMDRLLALAPVREEEDDLSSLTNRREQRLELVRTEPAT